MAKKKGDELSPFEKKILSEIKRQDLSEYEMKQILKQFRAPEIGVNKHKHKFSEDKVRIGLFGDSHIGHKAFNEDMWLTAAQYWGDVGVDAIYHSGDVIEGMSNRDGHVYELEHIGTSAQINAAAELMKYMPTMVYGITGNHENWAMRKANQGVIVGEVLENKIPEKFEFLGMDIADIVLWEDGDEQVILRLQHPGDGTAYAISYKTQKMINAMDENNKPDILAVGHYHKAEYINYRGIHAFQTGTLCDQTPWMFSKGIDAHVGFWTVDLYRNLDTGKLERIGMEYYPKPK